MVGTTNLGNGNIGTTIGGASSSTIKKAFIKLTFENDLLIEKEQEGLDFDVV